MAGGVPIVSRTTRTGREQQNAFFALMQQSLASRAELAGDMASKMPALMDALTDLALGHQYVKVQQKRNGELEERIYRRSPDFRSLQLMISLANYDTESNANAALAAVRAVTGLVQQSTMEEQAKQAKAITAKTKRETEAMDASFATEEQFAVMGIRLTTACIAFVQATQLSEFPKTEDAKQKYIERLKKKMKDIQAELLDMDKDDDE